MSKIFLQDIPFRLTAGLMLVGVLGVVVMFVSLGPLGRADFSIGTVLLLFFGTSILSMLAGLRVWAWWVRSLGYPPRAVLRAIMSSRVYPELEEAARRRDAHEPPKEPDQ